MAKKLCFKLKLKRASDSKYPTSPSGVNDKNLTCPYAMTLSRMDQRNDLLVVPEDFPSKVKDFRVNDLILKLEHLDKVIRVKFLSGPALIKTR